MKVAKVVAIICLLPVFIFVASSCDDESEEDGACFLQCPSDEWQEENLGPDDDPIQFISCDWSPDDTREKCEAINDDSENDGYCLAVWASGCNGCEDECNPFE